MGLGWNDYGWLKTRWTLGSFRLGKRGEHCITLKLLRKKITCGWYTGMQLVYDVVYKAVPSQSVWWQDTRQHTVSGKVVHTAFLHTCQRTLQFSSTHAKTLKVCVAAPSLFSPAVYVPTCALYCFRRKRQGQCVAGILPVPPPPLLLHNQLQKSCQWKRVSLCATVISGCNKYRKQSRNSWCTLQWLHFICL